MGVGMNDEHGSVEKQDSTDILLYLGGAVVAGVGITWLVLSQPWRMISDDSPVVEPPVVLAIAPGDQEPEPPEPAGM